MRDCPQFLMPYFRTLLVVSASCLMLGIATCIAVGLTNSSLVHCMKLHLDIAASNKKGRELRPVC